MRWPTIRANPARSRFVLPDFRGINRAVEERSLYTSLGSGAYSCNTPKGKNFVIDHGTLRPRNLYETVLSATISAAMNDGYTYKIKSMGVYSSKTEGVTPVLLLGVQVLSGTTHHHYCLLQRKIDMSNSWAEVKSGLLSVFGSNKSVWFQNANFEFTNMSGNFLLSTSDDSATFICNGADIPVAYVGAGGGALYEINSAGWKDVTINADTNVLTCADLATNGNIIEFYSRTNSLPGGLQGWPTYQIALYYVVNSSGSTFQIAGTSGGEAINITSTGTDVMARITTNRTTDCPVLDHLITRDNRMFGSVGNVLWYSDGFENDYAHSRDWTTANKTDHIPILTFEGDKVTGLCNLRDATYIFMENTIHRIANVTAPFEIRKAYSAKGTISGKSIAEINGSLIYATSAGWDAFGGSDSTAFLTDVLNGIWSADNSGAVSCVAGDTLYIHGKMTDPVAGTSGYGLIVVDIPTKNISYWDLVYGSSTTLTVDCTINSWFTTLATSVYAPQFWFADDDQIYRVATAKPTAGNAKPMTYYIPAWYFNNLMNRKTVARLACFGLGGAFSLTPICDGTSKTAKTITLPTAAGVTTPTQISASGKLIGWKLENVTGSVPELQAIEMEVSTGG